MPRSTRSAPGGISHCMACTGPETMRMVSCCQCKTWWHFECVNVDESIAAPDRPFICPNCQKPSPTIPSLKPTSEVSGRKAISLSGVSSTSSVRAKRARLQLEKLEAQKALMEKRLEHARREQMIRHEQEKQMQEAEIEQARLRMEQTIIEETFRVREEELLNEESDGQSVSSEQSSISKVRQWQKEQPYSARSSTMMETAPDANGMVHTQVALTIGEEGNIIEGELEGRLQSVKQTYIEPVLGGFIDRTASTLGTNVGENSVANLNIPSTSQHIAMSRFSDKQSQIAARNTIQIPSSVSFEPQGRSSLAEPKLPANPSILVPHPFGRSEPGMSSSNVNFSDQVNRVPVNNEVHQQRSSAANSPAPRGRAPLPRPRRMKLETTCPRQRTSFDDPLRSEPPPSVQGVPPERAIPEVHRRLPYSLPDENQRNQAWGPTPQQLAARHVMSKELPFFSGTPEDWPLFISSYNNTTQACGYSEAENLARLQRCLKGHALEAVRSRLLLPQAVPQVIETLETLYGRPELLIHSLLQKVRAVPAPKHDRLDTLIGFGMAVRNLCDHLEAGGQEAHLNNPMLLFEMVEKLPANMKLDWSLYKQRCGEVNLREFAQYMSTLVRAATDVTLHYGPRPTPQPRDSRPEKGSKDKNFCGAHSVEDSKTSKKVDESMNTSIPSCLICKDLKHRVKECNGFTRKSVDERWKVIQNLGLCRNCLGAHGRRPCKVNKRCEVEGCQLKHHPLLHSKREKQEVKQENTEQLQGSNAVTNHHYAGKSTLFRIIPVTLFGKNGAVSVYAFLDDGSERTLIEEKIADELGIEGEHLTVSRLDLPQQSLPYSKLAKLFPHLQGLPVHDYDQAMPCILIGNDNAHITATLKLREGQPGDPIAAKTRLGWTIYGKNSENLGNLAHTFHICECRDEQSLHELVAQFFSIESLGISTTMVLEPEEVQRANRILRETTKRVGTRFETGLLWKFDHWEFPDSYPMAFKRLQSLERRIQSDPVIGESIKRQIAEYIVKGYIHKASEQELNEADPRRVWYLPLGVALNPKKPSKVRIFCDAAAKVDGISLNSLLLKGPDLLNNLFEVLFGFREKRIAVCADLKEMFHQIQIRKEDRHAQRLLWRDDPTKSPEVYLMDVATFGATCSPCSAQFVKNLNAAEHAKEYPVAAVAIQRKHYVDDYLDSADSVEEAIKIADEVRHVHSQGGFHLRNWLSNSKEVLLRVGENDPSSEKNFQLDKGSSTERVLGLFWRPDKDDFTFSTNSTRHVEQPTKRQALSVVMSTFDPLGFLAFFLIHGKILIQELWRAKIQWDQLLPEKLSEQWTRWIAYFQCLDQISIPRCYFPRHSVKDILSLQLQIFVDASEEAFACVAYLRAEFSNGIEIALVAGKSKVAPLKALSIPRLELMAAVIGARLRQTIIERHSLQIDRTYLWSDSRTVLAWINSDHRNYRQFVACRVGEILSKTQANQWRWIPSKENVADDATKWGRGLSVSPSSRWFRGPDFLYLPEVHWPVNTQFEVSQTNEELRACLIHQEAMVEHQVNWKRFSQWSRLWRAIAYVYRFVQNLRRKVNNTLLLLGPLTQAELAKAETTIWRWVQGEVFPDEVAILSKMRAEHTESLGKLERTSTIRKLSPFMDENGVIRMDSRISAATFASFDTRFPIILPKDHTVTELVIGWYHRKYLHGNGETVVNEVRQRFHVPNLRTVVRKEKKKCAWCKLKLAAPAVPRMAPLPAARLKAFERPFSYVGVDYFGPIAVRVNRGSCKRWVALFTCLTVRAVHLEIVHSLTTESCKMAFRRFIARRGAPVEIYSDRGTNFVGSSNELQREMCVIEQQLVETFTNTNTRWIFNPPAAPHMGGAWERLVRSVKTALAAMYTTRIPNEETLETLVAEAEGVVNSRPLTFIPLEKEQQEALTPNHFLLLNSNGVVQTPRTFANSTEVGRGQWNLCRVMVDRFWQRWVREYMPELVRRTKWFEEVTPIQTGDLVIIVEDNVRNGWIRGRVTEVINGRDGRIRQAMVQTAKGLMRRPVAKLAKLDLQESKIDSGKPDQLTGRGDVTGNIAVALNTPRSNINAAR